MESLELLRDVLCYQGILQRDSSTRARRIANISSGFFLGTTAFYVITTISFVIFSAETSDEYNQGFNYVLLSLLEISLYNWCFWNKKELETLFADLDEMIEKRSKHLMAKQIYENAKDRADTLIRKVRLIMLRMGITFFSFTPVIASYWRYYTADYSEDTFQQLLPAALPWDWKTPIGYFCCSFIQVIVSFTVSDILITSICLIIGLCTYPPEFISDLESKLGQMQDILAPEKKKFTFSKQIELNQILAGFIEFHGEAKQFTNRISKFSGGVLLVYFTFIIASFGGVLLQIRSMSETGEMAGCAQICLAMVTLSAALCLFCNFGDQVTQRFNDVNDDLYTLNWYELPLEMQKQLPAVIATAQKLIYIEGFANTRATRDTYMKILKNQFSCIVCTAKL